MIYPRNKIQPSLEQHLGKDINIICYRYSLHHLRLLYSLMAPKRKPKLLVTQNIGEPIPDASEDPPPPPPPPTPLPTASKQQTLVSCYNSTYKATIIRLLSEDPEVQSILAASQKANILKLLQEDEEIRNTIMGMTRTKIRKVAVVEAAVDEPPPPLDKRILAFLRANLKTALTYEEFSEKVAIEYEDLELILREGFVEGFTTLILRNLANLELSQRPVHSFTSELTAVYIKVSGTKWRRDVAILAEIVFDFSQKVDIKIAEFREKGATSQTSQTSQTSEEWNAHLDSIRKQASGGIDRIRLIDDICKRVAEGVFVVI